MKATEFNRSKTMPKRSRVSSTARHQHVLSTSAATSPATPFASTQPASIGADRELQEHPGATGLPARVNSPSLSKEYSGISLGAITEGHYTEF
jgi:hypothetical protein